MKKKRNKKQKLQVKNVSVKKIKVRPLSSLKIDVVD